VTGESGVRPQFPKAKSGPATARAGEALGTVRLEARCERLVWGRMDYDAAVARMERRVSDRRAGLVPDALVFCEHESVITLGRNASPENVVLPPEELRRRGIELREAGRGGDVTWHGPGQLVGYPILQLEPARHDASRYLRDLEEVLIRALAEFGVAAGRREGLTGVWAADRKVASIGVRLSRWITSHGFALNVRGRLEGFEAIVPCGIASCRMVTVESLAGRRVEVGELTGPVSRHFGEIFGRAMVEGHATCGAAAACASPVAAGALQ